MKKDVRIVFMGTPDFAVGILDSLLQHDKNIVGVITAPDKPAGRGRKLKGSAVKEFAISKGLKILQPTNLKNTEFLAELKSLQADLQIIVAFRMLPKAVWSMPSRGTFNLHASLLPEYRGAAPINWAIINREEVTGVTTFFIDEKIDTGEIILKSEVPITPTETAGSLHDKLMNAGCDLVLKTVSLIEEDAISTLPQPQDGFLKEAPKLTTENTRIDWTQTSEDISAHIRGLSPYPVAWTLLEDNGEQVKMKIYDCGVDLEEHTLEVGQLITTKKEIKVATKNGFLNITQLQLPGKRKMDAVALLNGHSFTNRAKVL